MKAKQNQLTRSLPNNIIQRKREMLFIKPELEVSFTKHTPIYNRGGSGGKKQKNMKAEQFTEKADITKRQNSWQQVKRAADL